MSIKKFYNLPQPRQDIFWLFFGVISFLSFGLFHLGQFETVDEHFWKYERIPQYFTGYKNGMLHNDWSDTRINDKPGVTLALISGIGHLTHPIALSHRNREAEEATSVFIQGKKHRLYSIYDTAKTESLNTWLRLPILLFNAFIILPLLFFFSRRFLTQHVTYIIFFLFISLNPILIGISQIINPDALLWGFSAVALFAFFYMLEKRQLRYALAVGLFVGLALLSKYTANLLFLIFTLYTIALITTDAISPHKRRSFFIFYTKALLIIVSTAFIVFSLFMPEVLFVQKHFLYGTMYSPVFKPFIKPFIDILLPMIHIGSHTKIILITISSLIFFLTIVWIIPALALWLLPLTKKAARAFFTSGIIIMTMLLLLSLYNAWTNASLFPLDDLKEQSRVDGALTFPAFAQDPAIIFWIKALLVQAQNFIFSLHPLVWTGIIILWYHMLRGRIYSVRLMPAFYVLSFLPLLFFFGGLFADIFVNIRYGIMLYVPYLFLGAYGLMLLLCALQRSIPHRKYFYHLSFLIIIVLLIFSLIRIAPFYFNYESSLLPHHFVVVDSWGYGVFEAAQYLNHLPDAQQLTVWTDRRSFCQFFHGKCVISSAIFPAYTRPDYLVFSRRGMITMRLNVRGAKDIFDSAPYYDNPQFRAQRTVFRVYIDGRQKNFVSVIRVAP